MKLFLLALVSLMAIGAVSAQIDAVIIATDTDTADLYAASAAGTNEGVPVLVTDDGELTTDVTGELASLGIVEVVIVGGPLAVGTDVEDELVDEDYEVVRLAGVSSTGTAVEVAEYFYPDDIDCAVLVEETGDTDSDWEDQMEASNLAGEEGCPLIPVPSDDVPSSVMEFLTSRNVTNIRYVARSIREQIRNVFANFNLTEIAGTRAQVRAMIREMIMNHTMERLGIKPMVVVIAAPFWNDSLSLGGRPSDASVVWKISSTDGIQELIDYLKNNSITNVHVQGAPWLVAEIVSALQNNSIFPTHFSGENASRVAKDVLENVETRWHQRVQQASTRRNRILSKVRERIWQLINSTEARMNTIEAEIESMAAEGYNVTAINATFQQAKARLQTAKDTLAYDWQRARLLVSRMVMDVWIKAWKNNVRGRLLNIAEISGEETDGVSDAGDRIRELETEMRGVLLNISQSCNTPLVLIVLVDRARDLKDTITAEIEDGNYGRAAVAIGSAQELLRMAKSLQVICERRGAISSNLQNAANISALLSNSTMGKSGP